MGSFITNSSSSSWNTSGIGDVDLPADNEEFKEGENLDFRDEGEGGIFEPDTIGVGWGVGAISEENEKEESVGRELIIITVGEEEGADDGGW